MIKLIILIASFFMIFTSANANDFKKAMESIELRKSAMQGIWSRVKRLAPYVEFNENIEYGPEIAKQDAKEISQLLKRTKELWPSISNLSHKNLSNANPAVWVLPEYFVRLYDNAEKSALLLEKSLENDSLEESEIAMCKLGNACGTCHSSFRRLLTSQLANEASAWAGKYTENCN